ncbi:2-oxoglutarate dehydrogenase E1 component [Amphiplicatus metriothermophilus]|uniref:2-oxoglutarate dehydrogenase E1 component n=1 Tax=Amphiplicatus metriothermophilus TaxID=1519374 RepID=A0A239PKF6_9PROT|nr:2-oxoglutarate dehydrogenase E1 component [Amphiplicatus metriothermophilus]MBB5517363.1 2-oxoglutarate dehydrogenase E1 component [Amphiplicatus metriothermophilus]SNT68301.1 2-oxoglutarate dehydrogenase E1 component [Amphiplicatus metriothermophilus]
MAKDGDVPASSGSSGPRAARAESFLSGGNAAWLEAQYARFTADPASVSADLRAYFESLGDGPASGRGHDGPSWRRPDWPPRPNGELVAALDGDWAQTEQQLHAKIARRQPAASAEEVRQATRDSLRALMLIRAYRIRGHLIADLDPLRLSKPEVHPELDPATLGFTEADMDRPIFIDHVLGLETASLREILDILRRTYCGTFAVEFMHITDPERKAWLQQRIEGPDKDISFTRNGKQAILRKIIEAEGFENFLNTKYTGTKRFGLDGAEAMVPALEQIIKRGGALGVKEIVIGMPHRGRLNVLAAVMGKPYHHIFHEFHGGSVTPDEVGGSGDVKYHLGASSDREFDGNRVHLSLTANPSHLEAVDPVVLGKARSKQDRIEPGDIEAPRTHVLPLLLHGDAAFAGQGIVAECFGLSGLRGYRTGGTIHFIVNNQIGFTTSPRFARSSPYPSDVAKMVEAPIFHVNGDDPEAVVYAAKVATEYRQKFGADVVIDMFCYRRFGHNEGDEPSFTQPRMYKKIRAHKTTREIYGARLAAEGIISEDWQEKERAAFRKFLEEEFEAAKSFKPNKADWLDGQWSGFVPPVDDDRRGDTAVDIETLKRIGRTITSYPSDFKIHKTLARILEEKRKTFEEGRNIDWASAEALAFGSLLIDGFGVRLSGQDSRRGTFSQRHAVFIDQETEKTYTPLRRLKGAKATFEVHDSNLSEFAVMGFEYGYSLANPKFLVLWEAQFGDFANGAQVIIDQFLSSGERKWLRMCGLVLLLPHGYEGQGPEHSSARLERFLQLCAQDNMQVANCTTPANYFHILRRQMRRNFRKPLVLMTPKSLLRHKRCVSTLEEMGPGSSFHRVLWDDAEYRPGSTVKLVSDDKIRRVVICSGKVYYDLLEEREKRGIEDVYILRVEQFYPFPAHSLMSELQRFKKADMIWCQEEPKNMGAWFFMEPNIEWTLDQIGAKAKRARYVGRPAAASPATGLMNKHKQEMEEFLEEAFA